MTRSLELKRSLGFVLVLALVVFLAWRKASPIALAVDRSAWNVLIVTLDTTRADRLGAYGFAGADTPNIDRLAREGVLFEQAESAAPLTLPAHSSLFTGPLSVSARRARQRRGPRPCRADTRPGAAGARLSDRGFRGLVCA